MQTIHHNFKVLKEEPSLSCAMETSLLNWSAASKGITLADSLGLDNTKKPTSYTIGISSNSEIENAIKTTPEATYFKLKVNESEIERIVNCYQGACNLPFVVDANQGFKSFSKAKYWAEKLRGKGVAYFEQPFGETDLESHKRLNDQVEIPIIADESFQSYNDLEKVKDCFDGVNVKIIKTGGVLDAMKSLKSARRLGMKTILGCMSGSSVSINSASSLSSLTDFVDLDGVYLINNDPDLSTFS